MGGKVAAEYYRKWRASHPEYRARQNELRRKRREGGRGDRSTEYARRRERDRERRLRRDGDNGHLLESSLVRRARKIATSRLKPDCRASVYDDRHDDLVCVVILALCDDQDPYEAMRRFLTEEWRYRFWCIQDARIE